MHKPYCRIAAVVASFAGALLLSLQVQAQQGIKLDIPAQPLADSLRALGFVSNTNIIFDPGLVDGMTAPALSLTATAEQALTRLLEGTQLRFKFVDEKTVSLMPAASKKADSPTKTSAELARVIDLQVAQANTPTPLGNPSAHPGAQRPADVSADDAKAIPEILVKGSKVLNMDIRRSADDVQPYVVFDRDDIERSGASDVNTFLKERLTMNTVSRTNSQLSSSVSGSNSQINLRGLGSAQTLILIDGRRIASSTTGNTLNQPDINTIPLAAIERIEILPVTASGIYGGGATGGAINVILRRDYSGVEVLAAYGNSFEGDSDDRRIDASAGFSLEGGKTSVMLSGSYSERGVLAVSERDFLQRGRAILQQNNPAALLLFGTFPPSGATPNIRSSNGSPLFGPGSANFTSVPVGYAGGGGLAALQANAGRFNLGLADSIQSNGGKVALASGPTAESYMATVRREFGSRLDLFVEFAGASNEGRSPASLATGSFTLPVSAPTNPFGQAVMVTVPLLGAQGEVVAKNRNRRASAGAIFELSKQWRAEADYTWNEFSLSASVPASTSAAATAAVNTGALDLLRDFNVSPVDFGAYMNPPQIYGPFDVTLKDATLRVSGPSLSLPAGSVVLTGLLERQRESVDDGYQTATGATVSTTWYPSRSQTIDSAYLEARVPIVSGKKAAGWIHELDLQLAARWDSYTVNGATGTVLNPTPSSTVTRLTNKLDSVNPTAGLRYRPLCDVMVRMNYGTGFLPPAVNLLIPDPPNTSSSTLLDPRRGSLPTVVAAGQVQGGGNADLKPEESRSWSAGAVFTPRFTPGLRVSVDYVRIDKEDEIRLLALQQVVDNEAYLPGRITRGPAAADPLGVGIITSVNATRVNLAETRVRALDFALDYRLESGIGAFDIFAGATRQMQFETQVSPVSPRLENAGVTSSFPLKFKANGGLGWTLQQWSLGWNTRYFDSYLVADPRSSTAATMFLSQGSQEVASQIYHDLFAHYRFPTAGTGGLGSNLLSGLEIRLSVANVFNKNPPFDASNTDSYYSFFGDPRLRSYSISFKKPVGFR